MIVYIIPCPSNNFFSSLRIVIEGQGLMGLRYVCVRMCVCVHVCVCVRVNTIPRIQFAAAMTKVFSSLQVALLSQTAPPE